MNNTRHPLRTSRSPVTSTRCANEPRNAERRLHHRRRRSERWSRAPRRPLGLLGAYGSGVVAALTAQNTQVVTGVPAPPTDFLRLQIDTLFADVKIHAVKLGMQGSADIVATVTDRLAHFEAPNVMCAR